RIGKQQGALAVDYRKLVRDFTEKQSSLKVRLDEERVRLETLANDEKSWAGEFMQVKEAANLLAKINQTLEEASKEVSKHGGGLVIAYDKQIESIKDFVGPAVEIVQAIQKDIGALGDLAKKMAEGGGGVVEKTRELGGKVDKGYAALEGKVSPTTQPAVDKAELVKQAAAGLRRIADLLNEQSKLLSTFADDQPPVRGLYGWYPTVVMGERGLRGPLDKLLRQF
ncbi:unnamed protein product, partial [marine sediment metagenome]